MSLEQSPQRQRHPPITGVSFSSGGVHLFAQIGVVATLVESGLAAQVTDWYGCSAGCISAVCGLLRASPAWLLEGAGIFDLSRFTAIQEELLFDLDNSLGFVSPTPVLPVLGRMADTWLHSDLPFAEWTFRDVATRLPHARLHIIATNSTTGRLTTFNAVTHPTLRVLDAIHASIAVPGFFTPWRHPESGDIYGDGAILEYFPWTSISAEDKERTLVVACTSPEEQPPPSPCNFLEYIGRVMALAHRRIPVPTPRYSICINATGVDSLNFRATQEERLSLFQQGVTAARRFLQLTQSRHASVEIPETRPPSGDLHILSASLRHPDRTSDIRESHIPSHYLRISPHPQTEAPPVSHRRWSL